MSTPRLRRFVLVALLALTVGGFAAVSARADAPDVKVSSPAPGQHPFQTGLATVDTATGHVTVDLTGGWSWPTHGHDCNTDRAGAGVAVNWFDPQDRGFHVAFFNVNGGTANNTPGGPDDFGVGATGASGLNPVDNVVHPTENDTGTGAVVDITDPSQYQNWRGSCGVYSSDTILVNKNGVLSYTSGTVSHGNFGKATPASKDVTGALFTDPTPPANPALQGALLRHVYVSTADLTRVCALTYDVHPGTKASTNNGVGIPGGTKEVTAGDQAVASGVKYSSIHNGDNSIQSNGGTPAGNTCPQFDFPTITTQLSTSTINAGGSVSDTSTLSGESSDASGTVTYSVYSDSTCTTKFADGGTVNVTNGTVPGSNPVTFNTAGTYYWQASYSGDARNAPALSPCLDEKLLVTAPAVHILKTADAPQVNAGEQIGFTLTAYNNGSGDALNVKLNDTLPVKAGLSWSIAGQGGGWAGTCGINNGILTCGGANGVTIPAGTQQGTSTFTVHIVSPTTAATGGVCPGGSGKVDNTGEITTSNAGSDQDSAETCVAAPAIHIVKTPDAPQVNAGEPIGFTLTVYNDGTGAAKGVKLSDTLPTNAGLSWSIDTVTSPPGAGWAGTCAINAGILTCGGANGVTVAAGTARATSTFTVHITSPTTAATGGDCPNSGNVDNTGNVTTTNGGNDQSTASTCVAAPAIHIVKTADAPQVNAGNPIGFTLTVYNDGAGDAKGVKLTDTLPVKTGLSWTIDAITSPPGLGWTGTCVINAGILSCGGANGVTVPAGTSQATSTFTVHIISPTTAATGGVCPGGSGVINNTGHVTTTNDGNDQSTASTCVAAPGIHIVKTADAPQVNAGEQIGFTLTVYNDGSGDANGVKLSDTLPVKAGLSWSIDAQGLGWNGTCAINNGILTCGGANGLTVPAGTLQATSTYTVHIISPTTAATGGVCPGGSGKIDNTGNITTSNAGTDQSTASTCVAAPAIHIVKTADAPQVSAGDPIGFTLTVYNDGTGDAKGVKLSDTLPTNAGLSWSIDTVTSPPGSGWNGTCAINAGILTCGGANGVTVPAGTQQATSTFTVHIVSPTTGATGGVCPNGSGLVSNTGKVTTTNDGNDQSTATTCVAAPAIHILKTADAPQVSAGQQIGFTLTVYNTGAGDAQGVKLNDTLPTNTGLSWSIDTLTSPPGVGWNGTCAINAGILTCGGANGVTVQANTAQATSVFTVHIISPTTAATAGNCPNTGIVTNTGKVTTTNDGNDQSTASTCVAAPAIHIVKTADAPQVNAGEPIGFTLTVFNDGVGNAQGVKLTDTLPTNAGLSWTIDKQGASWSNTCSISGGVLSCGGLNGLTVPAGTTQGNSAFTVHITSPTTAATGGVCPQGSGVVDNTGKVTTTNDGSDQSSAQTCVAAPAIHIVKTADAPQVTAGDPIGFTLTVYNDGTGDAKGVKLSDTLPANAGLSWTIDATGPGWAGTCAINAGTLSCGGSTGITVPAGTSLLGSTFTVHITSPTTAATGGTCPQGSGVVDNTGKVTTTNDGNGQSSASTCVAGPQVSITKTADHSAPVSAGSQIGFVVEVKNTGTGDATGVKLNDPLPVGSGTGVTWAVDQSFGTPAQFVLNGLKGSQTLSLASSTLPAGADYKVHITAATSQTACSTYDNTATLTTGNGNNPGSASATEACALSVDLAVTKSGSPATQTLGTGNITWTMVVTNNGPDTDTNVKIADPMPTGNTYVSATTTQGSCSGGALLTCNLGTMANGAQVTIILITTPSTTGTQKNTVTVVGDDPETNLANNTASATVQVTGKFTPPPVYCVAVSKVTPKQLYVGRRATLTIHVTKHGKAVKGVRVRIKGPKLHATTKRSNTKGVIKKVVKMKKAGIIVFTPLASKRCGTKRVGVTGVFTPPVTG
jgi:uncharacterized repeat protein (TIGR01451 family)